MDTTLWQAAVDCNFTPETQAGWRRHRAGTQFDPEAYRRRWADLSARIAESSLDPASPGAQALLDEWCGLLAEFAEVATPEMRAGVQRVFGTIARGRSRTAAGVHRRGDRGAPGAGRRSRCA